MDRYLIDRCLMQTTHPKPSWLMRSAMLCGDVQTPGGSLVYRAAGQRGPRGTLDVPHYYLGCIWEPLTSLTLHSWVRRTLCATGGAPVPKAY